MVFSKIFTPPRLLFVISLGFLTIANEQAQAFTIFTQDFNDDSPPFQAGLGAIGVTDGAPTINVIPNGFTVSNISEAVGLSISEQNNDGLANLTAPTDFFIVQNNRFEAQDTDGEAIFTSPVIDISNFTDVSFSIDFTEDGVLEETGSFLDFVDVGFIIDGGTITLIPNQNGFPNSSNTLLGDFTDEQSNDPDNIPITPVSTISQTGLAGNDLQIVIGIQNFAADELTVFDNILVEGTEIPFEFSPGLGFLILGIIFGGNHFLKKMKTKTH